MEGTLRRSRTHRNRRGERRDDTGEPQDVTGRMTKEDGETAVRTTWEGKSRKEGEGTKEKEGTT